MSDNFGTGVSYVYQNEGYNYDTVVFQKWRPPLDSEVNLVQQIQRLLDRRRASGVPSGWLSMRPYYTSPLLPNKFYTQDPATAVPEYALVDGQVVFVTNTATAELNANLIDLGTAPATGNRVNGIFLEMWRVLLDPNSSNYKPDPVTVVDAILDMDTIDENFSFAVGENGLVLNTQNGGQTWSVQLIDTKQNLNGATFYNRTIGWVVGNSGTIARTASGGVNWTVLTTSVIEDLNGIHSVNSLMAWAVGNAGTILKTINGVAFTQLTSPTTANLRGVYFHDTLVGWVVGSNGTILKTTNGGSTWLALNSGTTNQLNSVFFYDLNYGFAVGNGGALLRTSDGGATWVSQSGNIWNGSSYETITTDLTDITMAPSMDEWVAEEEVSGQLDGTNKNFVISRVPVTKGDGNGVTTNDPANIVVTVNGVQVAVDSLVGANGQVILNAAPALCATVKVSYWHKISTAIFQGRVWVTGKTGTVIRTDNLGAQWTRLVPNTSYDLNAVAFADRYQGWVAGYYQTIRYTDDGGDNWSTQQSDALSRQAQRIYYEGNVKTVIYLNDDAIHPDANIETSKRVQIQYRIRVVDSVDPDNYPESGLGSSLILGLGPNSTGLYPFENMGSTTGDYGLWRAKCQNTVDGYTYAVPMFFANRRNTASYDIVNNTNGEHKPNMAVRPDLLTAAMVVDSDILDVRRRVASEDVDKLLNNSMDLLMSNQMMTRFVRDTAGGDKYGTRLLQVDGVQGSAGEIITGATLGDAAAGLLSSQVAEATQAVTITASTVLPADPVLSVTTGYFHQSVAKQVAVYVSNSAVWNGKPVPGAWSGLGTATMTFLISPTANTTLNDPDLQEYRFVGTYIDTVTKALKYIPQDPKLVKNIGSASSFYYHGVLKNSTGKVIEQWNSGIPDYVNYAIAYPAVDVSDTAQRNRAGSVEVHYFVKLTSAMIISINKIEIAKNLYPVVGDVPYALYTVSKVNSIDSGFSYKIKEILIGTTITIESVSGFPFLEGTLIEVVSYIEASSGTTNVRNGATVNFIPESKGLEKFCRTKLLQKSYSPASLETTIPFTSPGNTILGVSTTETVTSLTQAICWITCASLTTMHEVTITGIGTDTITATLPAPTNVDSAVIQVMYQQASLEYHGVNDSLLIAYDYVPYQSVSSLPTTLTVELATKPVSMHVSNLGTGGGSLGYPYANPLNQIPVNDILFFSEGIYHNLDPLVFNNFKTDGGYVDMPVYVPANPGESITLTIPAQDNLSRAYYSTCSKDLLYYTEGLSAAVRRKLFVSCIARVVSVSDGKFLPGEYLLLIFSRSEFLSTENYTGYQNGIGSVMAIYRLKNKPLTRR